MNLKPKTDIESSNPKVVSKLKSVVKKIQSAAFMTTTRVEKEAKARRVQLKSIYGSQLVEKVASIAFQDSLIFKNHSSYEDQKKLVFYSIKCLEDKFCQLKLLKSFSTLGNPVNFNGAMKVIRGTRMPFLILVQVQEDQVFVKNESKIFCCFSSDPCPNTKEEVYFGDDGCFIYSFTDNMFFSASLDRENSSEFYVKQNENGLYFGSTDLHFLQDVRKRCF